MVRELTPSERRSAILNILCRNRHETATSLASLFGVSERTIRNDLVALSCTYPIDTIRGRYGGIQIANWFHRGSHTLSSKQTALLLRLRQALNGEDLLVMNSILAQFALYWEYR